MQAGCGTGVGRAHGHAPRQNSPCKPPIRHTPRKNSPSTAKFGRFGLFSERWAKNIALSTQALEAGRIFSRRPPHTSHTAHTHGTKLSGHTACKAATGTKLSPHTACKATTGTKLSPHSKKHPNQPIRGEQGENYHGQEANNPSRENFFPQTTTHQPHRAHTPVQNSPSKPPHRRTHKRRGPRRHTVCAAPGPSSNDAAQSLTA